MSCSIWEKGAQGIEEKSNKEGTQATATHPVIFLEHVWAKIFQKVCEICQEASKPILLHERACQVWQCWTQCDRMWQMHSLLSLFSRYYLPGPHTYDGPKFEKWVKIPNISLVIAVPSSCYIPLSALSSSFCPALLLVWCFSCLYYQETDFNTWWWKWICLEFWTNIKNGWECIIGYEPLSQPAMSTHLRGYCRPFFWPAF